MPVQKFRSFDDASRALVNTDDNRPIELRIAALWNLSSQLARPLGFRGVRKYRTIEDANDDRDRMTAARLPPS